jgi:exodeoxyribonuclease-3
VALSVLAWNVRAPSPARALLQAEWLANQAADVVVLTECRAGRGCDVLRAGLEAQGRRVFYGPPPRGEYAVVVAAAPASQPTDFAQRVGYLTERVQGVVTPDGVEVIAVYVPSRGWDRAARAARKRQFLDAFAAALPNGGSRAPRVVIGDLNVLEPDHEPVYPHIEPWESGFYLTLTGHGFRDAYRQFHPDAVEHSWIGRSGDGYRYDHCFVADALLPRLDDCRYVHEPRVQGLSDHSAMRLELR